MAYATRQKDAVLAVLTAADGPLKPEEIRTKAAKMCKGIGMATVYRALQFFADEGMARPVVIPGDPPRYELTAKEHHHHFVCRRCHKVYDLIGCVKHLSGLVPRDFTVSDHDITLYGLCAMCH